MQPALRDAGFLQGLQVGPCNHSGDLDAVGCSVAGALPRRGSGSVGRRGQTELGLESPELRLAERPGAQAGDGGAVDQADDGQPQNEVDRRGGHRGRQVLG